MIQAGEVPEFMRDGFVELICRQFIVGGAIDSVLKLTIQDDCRTQDVAMCGVQSARSIEPDDFRWEPQTPNESAVGVEDNGTLRSLIARPNDVVILLRRLHIATRIASRRQNGSGVGERDLRRGHRLPDAEHALYP